MTGSLGGFNTALSALRYQQNAMDVAASNVANASTTGYVRRRAEAETIADVGPAALWSRPGVVTERVGLAGVQRLSDALLDARVRTETGKQGYLDTRATVLARVESGIGEPGDSGVAAAMVDFSRAWQDVANRPSDQASRGQVLARGAALADALAQQSRALTTEMADGRARVGAMGSEVRSVTTDLAATNAAISAASVAGTDAGALLDKRDQLALRLSDLTGATATLRPDGGYDVAVGGVLLVAGAEAGSLTVDPDGTTVSVAPPGGGPAVVVGVGGQVGAHTELLTTTLPTYARDLDAVARSLADAVNTAHAAAYDLAGTSGRPFFAYDPASPAGSIRVALGGPGEVAASAVPGGGYDGNGATRIGGSTSAAEDAYSRLVNGFGTSVASAERLAVTQRTLTNQVVGAREELVGVSLDEEMVAMVQAQRAYEAAARLMTTVDSVLDTLINRTGLLR